MAPDSPLLSTPQISYVRRLSNTCIAVLSASSVASIFQKALNNSPGKIRRPTCIHVEESSDMDGAWGQPFCSFGFSGSCLYTVVRSLIWSDIKFTGFLGTWKSFFHTFSVSEVTILACYVEKRSFRGEKSLKEVFLTKLWPPKGSKQATSKQTLQQLVPFPSPSPNFSFHVKFLASGLLTATKVVFTFAANLRLHSHWEFALHPVALHICVTRLTLEFSLHSWKLALKF